MLRQVRRCTGTGAASSALAGATLAFRAQLSHKPYRTGLLYGDRGPSMNMVVSLAYFVAAGLCEIGGGYLVWLWLRQGKSGWLAVLGAVVLVLYGVIPTLQPAHFGRVYAAYGGVFVVLSLLWGWQIDGMAPDMYDVIGGSIALLGVLVIMYWPR